MHRFALLYHFYLIWNVARNLKIGGSEIVVVVKKLGVAVKSFKSLSLFILPILLIACGPLKSEKVAVDATSSASVVGDNTPVSTNCTSLRLSGSGSAYDSYYLVGYTACPGTSSSQVVRINYNLSISDANVCFVPFNTKVSSATPAASEFCVTLPGKSGKYTLYFPAEYNTITVVKSADLQKFYSALQQSGASSYSMPSYSYATFR